MTASRLRVAWTVASVAASVAGAFAVLMLNRVIDQMIDQGERLARVEHRLDALERQLPDRFPYGPRGR